ncbi:PREDICTED: transcriptional regulator SUPERMAN-like [Nelumbo nucifera]|uniref:Transcriptional regulator SUPERMAN-like n=2 Tax=Nelumbo nucifera TaxID=4432 RepID=A0A1U8AJ07_NELNU|nr:PREDICTED: transcriptional regulator SUPERMAN-like [Nelumbo nucifera]DAD36727.1 TPA_asm: hypothetical protein HUJ06_007368 [Nelumbo nucifera]
MERNRLMNSMKDSSGLDRIDLINSSSNNKVRDSWEYNNGSFGGDMLGGFPWPPRSYTCSFCKREFKSAQALGGHMNVHRRDRARMRQSPPWEVQCSQNKPNPNPNPSPNVDFLSSSHSTRLPSFTYTFPSLLSPSLACFSSSPTSASSAELKTRTGSLLDASCSSKGGDTAQSRTMKPRFGVRELKGLRQQDECKLLKTAEIVRLDLEIGLCRESKEDLDLELRLGYY